MSVTIKRSTIISMILCYTLIGFLFYDGCIKRVSYNDGTYCAKVNYSNPNTGKQSNYRLTVHIEDNKVTRLDFPNGGWLDDSHFTPPEFNRKGIAIIKDDRDYQYIVKDLKEGECNE